ncbi:MAG: tetratricopeptide repeat protein [Methanoregula sp.]|jgi:tetratricopeptide (TPR) repeat protein|nr:tetratricopeptide repeat protein [Methanoregula sp.]
MKVEQIVSILAILTMVAVCIMPVAAADDSDAATDYYNIAQQAIAAGDYQKALEYFDMALASNTTLLGMGDGLMYTYKDRVAVLTDLGRYDEAIVAADQGIALYPKEAGLWNNKGYTYYQMGRYSDAASAYDTAVTLDSGYLKGWINKGDALVKAGRSGEAVDAYKMALTLDPGNADATTGLAEAQELQKPDGMMTLVYAAIAAIAAGLVIWYMKFRKTGDEKPAGKEKK